jgi:hypothetical protein
MLAISIGGGVPMKVHDNWREVAVTNGVTPGLREYGTGNAAGGARNFGYNSGNSRRLFFIPSFVVFRSAL